MTILELHALFVKSNGICTDTRTIEANQLFFAIKGENFDGNRFAEKALESGATHAVVQDPGLAHLSNIILVEDVLKTLQDLACYHRQQFDIPVIGITGSNGKTTSKELINAVLAQKYNVLVTQGNLNNHLGVPFTLLNLNSKHQIAIIEMGANKPGDIKELSEIACPNFGVITNIGKAHIEGFGGLNGVIKTKTELYRNITNSKGKLFVNFGNQILFDQIINHDDVIGYGKGSDNIEGSVVKANPFITFKWQSKTYSSPVLETNLVGAYNLNNYLLAIAIGHYFKVPNEKINSGIINYIPTNNRSQVTKTERNMIIVDCYNANPSSMQSAIDSFKAISAKEKLMILGDMLELGDIKEQEHQVIIDITEQSGISTLFVGSIFRSQKPKAMSFETTNDLIKRIDLREISGKTILLKGSRGIKLEQLIALL